MTVKFKNGNEMFQFYELAKAFDGEVWLNETKDGKDSLVLIGLGFNQSFDIKIVGNDKEEFIKTLTERGIICV